MQLDKHPPGGLRGLAGRGQIGHGAQAALLYAVSGYAIRYQLVRDDLRPRLGEQLVGLWAADIIRRSGDDHPRIWRCGRGLGDDADGVQGWRVQSCRVWLEEYRNCGAGCGSLCAKFRDGRVLHPVRAATKPKIKNFRMLFHLLFSLSFRGGVESFQCAPLPMAPVSVK